MSRFRALFGGLLPAVPLAFAAAAAAAGAAVLPVSPGAPDRLADAASACPTFSWSGVEGAVAYELALYDVSAPAAPVAVWTRRVEGAALGWTPDRAACLAPGRTYAWLVRAELAGSGLADWSAPQRFRVPAAPSRLAVDEALARFARWQVVEVAPAGRGEVGAEPPGNGAAPVAGAGQATDAPDAPPAGAFAALRGELPDTTGNAYGVLAIANSTQGAGLVARNASSGPDLVLDGEAQAAPDTLLTQGGIDRSAAGAATFEFRNSGAGALTLQVDGVAVDIATTPIGWTRLASVPAGFADGVDNDETGVRTAGNRLTLDGTTFNLVEGPGSSLHADTLDGRHGGGSSGYQGPVTGICPNGKVLQAVNEDGTVTCREVRTAPKVTSADTAGIAGENPSLVIGMSGAPLISYYDRTNGNLKVLACDDGACSGGGETISTVDASANDVGLYSSITISNDEWPLIAYYDKTASALKVVHCNDDACAGGDETITTIDSTGDVGSYPALAVSSDGFPVIAYYDATNGNLKVVHCNDDACVGGNETITTVDNSANDVGRYASIALVGSVGRQPTVAYVDVTTHALRVLRCNDAACSGTGETIARRRPAAGAADHRADLDRPRRRRPGRYQLLR